MSRRRKRAGSHRRSFGDTRSQNSTLREASVHLEMSADFAKHRRCVDAVEQLGRGAIALGRGQEMGPASDDVREVQRLREEASDTIELYCLRGA